MIITNKFNLPESLVKAVSTDKHNKDGCISATTLLKGVKEILLTERHWDELADDVSDRLWALFGTAVHKLLEEANPNAFTEEHFEKLIETENGSVTVTGQVDLYDMENKIVTDYKTASVWKVVFKSFDDWKRQGEIYAWLMKENGLEVKKCRFIAMMRDWSVGEAERKPDYPQSQVHIFEFDIGEKELEEGKRLAYEKANAVLQAIKLSDDEVPPCSSEERWEKDTTWAVKKEGRKTALKVCDTQKDAEEYLKGVDKGFIEERKGECGKCKRYCICKDFCNFYKENVKEK